jgi:hypothetical protein
LKVGRTLTEYKIEMKDHRLKTEAFEEERIKFRKAG